MGREIRRVPADWVHPEDDDGRFIPLSDGFDKDLAEWNEGNDKWRAGLTSDYRGGWKSNADSVADGCKSYADYAGGQPKSEEYMPDWPDEQRTHLMMYETTSEGTPISPAFETPEKLARWLADNGASAFAGRGATYEQWLATCRSGSAPSAVYSARTGFVSGVEFEGDHPRNDRNDG